jgi:hypothetical protein
MLPRKLHLEQINRFHDNLLLLSENLKNESDQDKKYKLALKYIEMTDIWESIDNFIEFELKHKLDILNH